MKISSRIITTDRTPIFFGHDSLAALEKILGSLLPDTIIILVDTNTRNHCLPVLLSKVPSLDKAQILEIQEGETGKSLATAEKLWAALMNSGIGRNTLLVNLGGGVISDLGGFVAAGYLRGIRYINVPTSLIGQADAAIGGKTGVNLGEVKNQVGFLYPAQAVVIFPGFLKTLPAEHLRSGLAEIVKSALVGDAIAWRRINKHPVKYLVNLPVEDTLWCNMIAGAIKLKNKVVMQDFRERKLRKVLNFGHTIGHALEAHSHRQNGSPLLHGDAVAAGMVCAAYLSYRKSGLGLSDYQAIKNYLTGGFPCVPVDPVSFPAIMELMKHDKKRRSGQLQFTLISKPGYPRINISCDEEEILDALAHFNVSTANPE
ncbi:MAG: 3-dehydroquinate synthase [Bacteroidales bacterium]